MCFKNGTCFTFLLRNKATNIRVLLKMWKADNTLLAGVSFESLVFLSTQCESNTSSIVGIVSQCVPRQNIFRTFRSNMRP